MEKEIYIFKPVKIDLIREKVIIPVGNELAKKLMSMVYKGTDIEGLENYPKRTGKQNF